MMYYSHGAGFGVMWLLGLVLLAGVVVLVVVAVRAFGVGVDHHRPGALPSMAPPVHGSRAREILEERYARGEIDTEEFQERIRNLGAGG